MKLIFKFFKNMSKEVSKRIDEIGYEDMDGPDFAFFMFFVVLAILLLSLVGWAILSSFIGLFSSC